MLSREIALKNNNYYYYVHVPHEFINILEKVTQNLDGMLIYLQYIYSGEIYYILCY